MIANYVLQILTPFMYYKFYDEYQKLSNFEINNFSFRRISIISIQQNININYMMPNTKSPKSDSPSKQYKIITQINHSLIDNLPYHVNHKSPQNLQPIRQHSDPSISQKNQQNNNIFQSTCLERLPQHFLQAAKSYQVIGYKFMKDYNPKKQKKKLNYKRTDSASSKLSKMSSVQSTISKEVANPKDSLLQEVEKIESTIKANYEQSKKMNIKDRYYHSKELFYNFEKIWDKSDKRINKKLGRKQNCSLVALSSAYRQKVQKLQRNTLLEKTNHIQPLDWCKVLRDDTRLQNLHCRKFVQKIQKTISCQRLQRFKFWENQQNHNLQLIKSPKYDLKQNNRNSYAIVKKNLQISGLNKLKKQIQWVAEISSKKFNI